MQTHILIVEDDNDINKMLSELLTLNGYRTTQAYSGTEALLYLKKQPYDAVILDLMLPGMTGETLLGRIKAEAKETAVIIASAKDDTALRILLLRAGADDYVTKPFDTEELLARLEAVLRRSHRSDAKQPDAALLDTSRTIRYKDLILYPDSHTAFAGDSELSLTKREYQILELFMEHPDKVFTKSNLYESVWNEEFLGEDNAINVHISNIRQKLSKHNPNESYIQTVWGIGFKMK
ncbi:MAG: response regulator transcription factor [Eubacterium sp.]|nr:response regulator transcription factor [Eubacterium sp.]